MAEFCLECWNKFDEKEHSPKEYVISRNLELCEGCGELKRVIIMERGAFTIRIIMIPFKILLLPFFIICLVIKFFRNIVKNHLQKRNRDTR